jgi:hypothetical protein
MPIIHMTSDPDKVPAGAQNLRKYEGGWGGECPNLWLYDTHHGFCIRDYERNGYDDSDWYMVVWNPEKNEPETIEFASTRGWSYPCYGSKADATPEVLAKYQAWEAEQERQRNERKAAAEAARPARGKTLKVVRGRKVPIGTEGICIWTGSTHFGGIITRRGQRLGGRSSERVGIKDAAGEVHWTAAANVEVVAGKEVI